MNYQETLDYIGSINWKGSQLGLERITELMGKLGDPQKDLKFIHIAGTNGKGSTAAFLSSILTEAGYKTGLFTSPFIEEFNERMQINGVNISNDELARITTYVRPFAESMEDKPTEFELNTAISILYYKNNGCDIVVFEVGMGGALDSTNVIDSPEAALITAIGLDHTAELGNTPEEIATTKAGIIKKGTSVVIYKQDAAIEDVIKARCGEVGASYTESEPEKVTFIDKTIDRQRFSYEGLGEICIPLIGDYQLDNAALAIKTIEVLQAKGWKISEDNIKTGFAKTRWPGRFEVIMKDPVFIVDGAHNPHGIRATAAALGTFFKDEKLVFIYGVMADKDYNDMLAQILPLAKEVLCVTPANPRALPAEELSGIIRDKGVDATVFETVADAVDAAVEKGRSCAGAVALGSLYMIGELKGYARKKYGIK